MEAIQFFAEAYRWLFVSYIVVFGLLIGSFLNVVAIRIPQKESISFPPSHCMHCHHRLGPLDLVPVFSYLFLSGKCRYCKDPITILYPVGEAVTAVLFGLIAWQLGLRGELLVGLFLASILAVAASTDIRYMLIPNRIVYFAMIVGAALRICIHPLPYWNYGVAFVLGGGIMFMLALVSKGGMGGGDMKLFAFIGLMLGIKLLLLAIFLSSLIGTLYGGWLLVRGAYVKGKFIAFAPFIMIGTMLAYLGGDFTVSWYVQMLQ